MSGDVTLKLTIRGEADGSFAAAIDSVRARIDGLGKAGSDAGQQMQVGFSASGKAALDVSGAIDHARSSVLRYAAAAAGAFALPALAQYADTAGQLRARIQQVTASATEYAAVQARIEQVSRSAYKSVADVSEVFIRAAGPMQQLGYSTQTTLDLTEALSLGLVVSAANADASGAAINAFGKAMQTGTLRGQEFNTVLTAAPSFIDAVGKALGKTRAELVAMAEAGDLNIGALAGVAGQLDELRAAADAMPVTLADALQRFSDAFMKVIDDVNQGAGAMAALTGAIDLVSRHMDKLVAVGGLVAAVYGARLVSAMTLAATRMIGVQLAARAIAAEMGVAAVAANGLSAALLRLVGGPVGALVLGVGAVTVGLVKLAKATIEQHQHFDKLITQINEVTGRTVDIELRIAMGEDVASREIERQLEAVRAQATALWPEIEALQARVDALGGAWWKTADTIRSYRAAKEQLAAVQERSNGLIQQAVQLAERLAEAKEREAQSQAVAASTQGLAEEIEKQVRALERQAIALDATGAAMADYDRAAFISQKTSEIGRKLTDAETAAIDRLYDRLRAAAAGLDAARAASERRNEAQRRAKQAADEARRAKEQLLRVEADHTRNMIEQAGAASDSALAIAQYKLAVLGALDTMREQIKAGLDATKAHEQFAGALRIAAGALGQAQRAAEAKAAADRAAADIVSRSVERLEEEARTVGMTAREREIHNLVLDAEARARELVAAGQRENAALTAEEIAGLRDRANAAMDTIDAAELGRRAAEDGARAWTDFAGSMVDAMGRGMRGVQDLFRQMLQDLVKQLLSSQILRLMSGIFGGSAPGLAMAAGQGAPTSMLGAMFGGGGGLNLGSLAGGITSGGGIIGGINSGLFGAAGLGGMLAGLGGSVGAFGAGMTVAGSAGLMAATQFGAASLAAGNLAVGLGAMVPVVGWIVAAAAAINSLTGGRLFGTSYKPESSTSTLSIGAGGASASAWVAESRQRSLFRGTARRTRAVEAGEEAVQAAHDLYAAVRQTMVQAAQMLRADAPEMLAAALRLVSEYDKKGKVTATKIFVDLLGRSWEEASEELAQKRIMAEAIIATIDAALGAAPQAVGASAADAIGDAMAGAFDGAGREFGEVLGGMFHALKGASIAASAAAQGEASAIAERWRGDAETLLDGAQMLLAAATDIRRGAGLLGDGSLTQVADLVDELAYSGEALVAAYRRIAASAALLDQALAMSGVSLGRAREDVVRFAADVATAAGGIERASALWSGYFTRFYSDSERLAFQLSQAVSQAVSQFSDIGLDLDEFRGDGGMSEFRALFEAMMPTLSAAAVVEWLEAAEALGIVIELSDQAAAALGEVSDGLGAIAASLEDFMTAVEEQIAAFAPPLTFAERIEQITKGIGALIRRAEAMGATEEQLARVRLLGQLQLQEVLDEQRAALRQYTDFVGQFADAGTPITDFGRSMRDIEQTMIDAIERAHELARAAGLQSAAEGDLAMIHAHAARQAARAMMEMERAILSTAASLGYLQTQQTQLDAVNAEIERIGRDPFAAMAFAARLEELFARRADLEAMDPARFEQAAALAGRLRDLAAAVGETAIEAIDRLGISATQFLADLGFAGGDLGDSAVADALVSAARLLGVEVADLAARMGVDVGDLADPSSAINDAFERAIARLPDALRGGVAEAFAALEAGDAGAREALVTLIGGLPSNLRQLFEPLLDDVDPEAFEDSMLAGQTAANTYLSAAADHLAAIRAAIEAPQPGGPGRLPGEKTAESEQWDRVIAAEERSEQTIDRRTAELATEVRQMRAALDDVARTLTRLSTQIAIGVTG